MTSDDSNDRERSAAADRKPVVRTGSPGDGGPDEAVNFLRGAIGDLARIARRHRLDMLGYLLDMAYIEASELDRSRKREKHDV